MNKTILLGRLVKDIEVRYTQSAEPTAVTNFSVAVERAFKREGEPDADFFNCVCFGKQGENIAHYFHKGNRIAVAGRLQNRSWTDNNGVKRYTTDVIVESFDFCESKQTSGPQSAADNFVISQEEAGDSNLPFN